MKKSPRIRKNQNFENWASTCIKLAQIRPRAKISDPDTFGSFGKREQTNTQTHKIHVLWVYICMFICHVFTKINCLVPTLFDWRFSMLSQSEELKEFQPSKIKKKTYCRPSTPGHDSNDVIWQDIEEIQNQSYCRISVNVPLCYEEITNNNNLQESQLSPDQPDSQSHVYPPSVLLVHVPCWHGLRRHGSVMKGETINNDILRTHCK